MGEASNYGQDRKHSILMEIRILRPEEYKRLFPIWEEGIETIPSPDVSTIIIAEDDKGEISAFWVMQLTLNIEPVWISPKHRSSTLGSRLFRAVKVHLLKLGVSSAMAHAVSAENAVYLKRLGFTCTNWTACFLSLKED